MNNANILKCAHRIAWRYKKSSNPHGDTFTFDEPTLLQFVQAITAQARDEAKLTGVSSDAYAGAREDLAIWEKRCLEAERHLRAAQETNTRLVAELNDTNGPMHMGEPSPPTSKAITELWEAIGIHSAQVKAGNLAVGDRLQAAVATIEAAIEPMAGWLNVYTKLPETEKTVLVSTDEKRVFSGHFEPKYGWVIYDGDEEIDEWVTHWMPLPGPPN